MAPTAQPSLLMTSGLPISSSSMQDCCCDNIGSVGDFLKQKILWCQELMPSIDKNEPERTTISVSVESLGPKILG